MWNVFLSPHDVIYRSYHFACLALFAGYIHESDDKVSSENAGNSCYPIPPKKVLDALSKVVPRLFLSTLRWQRYAICISNSNLHDDRPAVSGLCR